MPKDILFKIAITLDLPTLLAFCESDEKINNKLCQNDNIWNYLLNRDFPDYKKYNETYDERNIYNIFREKFDQSKQKYYIFLNNLNNIKKNFKLKISLYDLFNTEILILYGARIEEIPKEIRELINLKELYLYGNNIKTIPKEIGELKNLERLILSHNQIRHIPKEIGNLKKLQYLYLDNNEIKTIPPEIGKIYSLYALFLQNNRIRDIPEEIGNIQNLERIDIYKNEIQDARKIKTILQQKIPNLIIEI